MVKINCPFCVLNCSLGIKKEKFKFAIEYENSLCAKGNAIPLLLDSPKRLSASFWINNGEIKKVNWEEIIKEISSSFKKYSKEEIAIGLDSYLKEDEKKKIYGFFKSLGIENIFTSYLDSDLFFLFKANGTKIGNIEMIDKADFILFIGDVFGSFPLIAKKVLKRKYEDKKVYLCGIDVIKNRIFGFANQFLTVKIGTEPLVLFSIAEKAQLIKTREIKIAEVEKEISPLLSQIDLLTEKLLNAQNGLVIMSLETARSFEPILYSLLAQVLCNKKTNLYFIGLKNDASILGDLPFGEILEKLSAGKIKMLINFGSSFSFLLPQINQKVKNCEKIYLTSFYRLPWESLSNIYLLPQSLNIEDGNNLLPYSGSKTVSWWLAEIAKNLNWEIKEADYPKEKIYKEKDIISKFGNYLDFYKKELKEKIDKSLVIIGKKEPFYFLDLFEKDNYLYLNKKKEIKLGLPIKIKKELEENIGVLELENLENKKYFPLVIDGKEKFVILIPLIVENG
uniref:4Fe-4S Mo/W bis-MGD-type domain-containing protein n=1 Tax=candidate division WOR-3 bacterium TaxID=2052148 RepID=A0A7V3ZVL2_UNCW3